MYSYCHLLTHNDCCARWYYPASVFFKKGTRREQLELFLKVIQVLVLVFVVLTCLGIFILPDLESPCLML